MPPTMPPTSAYSSSGRECDRARHANNATSSGKSVIVKYVRALDSVWRPIFRLMRLYPRQITMGTMIRKGMRLPAGICMARIVPVCSASGAGFEREIAVDELELEGELADQPALHRGNQQQLVGTDEQSGLEPVGLGAVVKRDAVAAHDGLRRGHRRTEIP